MYSIELSRIFVVILLSLNYAAATITTNTTTTTRTPKIKIAECKAECIADYDCRKGLFCTYAHRNELSKAGYNLRRAYCPRTPDILTIIIDPITNTTSKIAKRVCYDPSKIIPKNVTTPTTTTPINCPKTVPVTVPISKPISKPITTPTTAPLLRVPVNTPVRAPVTTPVRIPIVVVVPPTSPMPEQCPDKNIKDAQYCDYFKLSSCFIGEPTRTCYRTLQSRNSQLFNTKLICNNIEHCIWGTKQCRCNSKFGWMCQTVQPDWVLSSTCFN